MELTALTLEEAAAGLAAGRFSAVELTRAHLAAIEARDPHIASYVTVTASRALERATASDEARALGASRGALDGIPLAHKDLFESRGVRTTAGSGFLSDHVPDRDAVAVAALDEAGAVMLGKLNMHEWAMSVTTDNPFFGTCRNPWDLSRSPGGSSGGSAAALAAELCTGSLGSDTAGSIRLPAAFCGVVGLKPTAGRVSKRGAIPLSRTLDHAGPMARRVRDVARLLQPIAGYDPEDPFSRPVPVADYLEEIDGGVAGWRIALLTDGFFPESKRADPAVLDALERAAATLASEGATVERRSIEGAIDAFAAAIRIIQAEAALFHRERLATASEGFSPDVRAPLERGAALRAGELAGAYLARESWRRQVGALFDHFDLLLTPAAPCPAPPIDGSGGRDDRPSLLCYLTPWNLAGVPAIVLPCGMSEGLPLGLQLVAPAWEEARLLRGARAFERATGWHAARPPLVTDHPSETK